MSDKYAMLSPYVYCADNPVKLVDPNGDTIVIIALTKISYIVGFHITRNSTTEPLNHIPLTQKRPSTFALAAF